MINLDNFFKQQQVPFALLLIAFLLLLIFFTLVDRRMGKK